MHAREAAQLLDALASPEPNVISAAASVIDDPTCREALVAPGRRRRLAARGAGDPRRRVSTRRTSIDRPTAPTPRSSSPPRRRCASRSPAAIGAHMVDVDDLTEDRGHRARDRCARLASGDDRRPRTAAHPRRRHRHRRQPRAPLRRRLARRRDRRRDLRVGQRRRRARSRSTRGRSSSSPGGRTSRSRSGARSRSSGRSRRRPETHGPQGLGHAELPPPPPAAVRPPRRRPHPRGGAAAARRDHARHARAADQPRHRASCASRRCRGCSRATR